MYDGCKLIPDMLEYQCICITSNDKLHILILII